MPGARAPRPRVHGDVDARRRAPLPSAGLRAARATLGTGNQINMAKIPRPPKQGNTTSYVDKVAAGYTKILAGEVDADFDTIYDAWNSGADTANLKDDSITGPKLKADAVGPRELADG